MYRTYDRKDLRRTDARCHRFVHRRRQIATRCIHLVIPQLEEEEQQLIQHLRLNWQYTVTDPVAAAPPFATTLETAKKRNPFVSLPA
jgi:hypothetical protein